MVLTMTADNSASCFSTKVLYRWYKTHVPEELGDKNFLSSIENIPLTYLLDDKNWVSIDVWSTLLHNIQTTIHNTTGDTKTAYQLGYETTIEARSLDQLAYLLITPLNSIIATLSVHILRNINSNLLIQLRGRHKHGITLEQTPLRKEWYNNDVCAFNRGSMHAILDMRGYTDVCLEEHTCAAHKGDSCTFEATWTNRSIIKALKFLTK